MSTSPFSSSYGLISPEYIVNHATKQIERIKKRREFEKERVVDAYCAAVEQHNALPIVPVSWWKRLLGSKPRQRVVALSRSEAHAELSSRKERSWDYYWDYASWDVEFHVNEYISAARTYEEALTNLRHLIGLASATTKDIYVSKEDLSCLHHIYSYEA